MGLDLGLSRSWPPASLLWHLSALPSMISPANTFLPIQLSELGDKSICSNSFPFLLLPAVPLLRGSDFQHFNCADAYFYLLL